MQTASAPAGRSVRHGGVRARVLAAWAARRPASGRTPTPRRTSSAAATATGCWSSSRRTPPTPPPGPGCPAGCGWSSTGDDAARRPTPARRWTPTACRGWPRCGRRPSATRPRSVGRFGVGFAAVLAVSDEPAVRVARPAACGSAPTRTRAEVAARARRSPRSWPAAAARCRCCGCRGRPRARRRRASPPRSSCRCAPGARAAVAAALAGAAGRPAARAARAGRGRGRRRRRRPHDLPRAPRRRRPAHRRRPHDDLAGRRSARASCPPRCWPTGRSRSAPGAAGR